MPLVTYAQIMASQPSALGTTSATLGTAGGNMSGLMSNFAGTANLAGSFAGVAQAAQSGGAASTLARGQQILSALARAQATISSTSGVMQAAKTKLIAIVAAAKEQGLVVSPVGIAAPGPPLIAQYTTMEGSDIPATMVDGVVLEEQSLAKAAAVTAQIKVVESEASAADLSEKLALAGIVASIVAAILPQHHASTATLTVPKATTATMAPNLGTHSYGLAGAGPLTAEVATMGGAGTSTLAVPSLATTTGGAGASPQGSSSMLGMGGAPVGGHPGGAEEQRVDGRWDLVEDEDIWGTRQSGPAGVLS
jgi:hypothetical protein